MTKRTDKGKNELYRALVPKEGTRPATDKKGGLPQCL